MPMARSATIVPSAPVGLVESAGDPQCIITAASNRDSHDLSSATVGTRAVDRTNAVIFGRL